MKHFSEFFILLAMSLAVMSCAEELRENNGRGNGNNGKDKVESIYFTVGDVSAIDTKAVVKKEASELTTCIPLSEPGDPDQVVLVETVEDMDASLYDDAKVSTKGVPVYTETFVGIYKNISTIPYKFGETKPYSPVQSYWSGCVDEAQRRYKFDFVNLKWPEGTNFIFFLAAPADLTKVADAALGYSNLSLQPAADGSNGIISFDYLAPDAAKTDPTLLKDLLFTSKSLTPESYGAGAKVLFYHTMAGVKFKSANAASEGLVNVAADGKSGKAKVTNITSIKLTNIVSNGHCVVTPDQSYNGTDSNASGSVDKSAVASAWTPLATVMKADFSMANTGVVNNKDQFAESTAFEGTSGNLGQNNLNSVSFDKTFMFVPQKTGTDVVLTIEYTIEDEEGNVAKYKKAVKFADKEWKAGKLYTYTLSVNHVAVKITDKVSELNRKYEMEIRNTGNVDAYLRAAVVGNWYDTHGLTTVVSATGNDRIYNQLVCSWGGFPAVTDGYGKNAEGEVVGLDTVNWIKGDDGFYYYIYKVKPQADVLHPLFESYTSLKCPKALYDGTSHFEMDIMVQAVDASKVGNISDDLWEKHFSTEYDK